MTADTGLPNILLVVMDSVRARNTSLHSHCNETTPFLERFREDATVYEQARAPSIWSVPSHVSIFTGTPPHEHAVHTEGARLDPSETIWERLRRMHGYETGLFTSNIYLTEIPIGLSDAFEHVEDRPTTLFPDALTPTRSENRDTTRYLWYLSEAIRSDKPARSLANGLAELGRIRLPSSVKAHLYPDDDCSVHVDNVLDWTAQRDGPWAACVNLMDAHMPYEPAERANVWGDSDLEQLQSSLEDPVWSFVGGEERWWKRDALAALYDGAIRQMDEEIERLVSTLRARSEFENTLLVVTSDHGDGFGECSAVRPAVRSAAHSYGIGENLLHVPLLVKRPGQSDGRRVTDLAALRNFPDVVLHHVSDNHEEPTDFEAEDGRIVSTSLARPNHLKRAREHYDDVSLVEDDAYALYEDDDGPGITKHVQWGDDAATVTLSRTPQSSILSVVSDGTDELQELIAEHRSRTAGASGRSTGDVDDDVRDRLAELGYL